MTKTRSTAALADAVETAFADVAAAKPNLTVPDAIEPLFLDITAAANYLALSVPSIRAEMYAGRLAAKKYGRKAVFELSELRRYASELPSWEPS